jgi:Leucine-rich repeat (LRR) protein
MQAKTGLDAGSMRLSHVELGAAQDHQVLGAAGMPTKTELDLTTQKKIVVAEYLHISAEEVTDSQLSQLCTALAVAKEPVHALRLDGCAIVTSISCLAQLSSLSTLCLSGCTELTAGVVAFANTIKGMGRLSSLDISDNGLYAEGTKLLAEALKGNQTVTELNISDNDIAFDGTADGNMSGVNTLAGVIPSMKALLKLDVSNNNLRAAGGSAFASGLQGNQVITVLNIASNQLGVQVDAETAEDTDLSGVVAIADAIKSMGALSTLIFNGDYSDESITITASMTAADCSGKELGVSGVVVLAGFAPKCR